MNTEEKEALEASIKHWEQIVIDYEEYDEFYVEDAAGAANCACCQLQMVRQDVQLMGQFDCFHTTGNCPIANYTGQAGCELTPYYAVTDDGEHPNLMLEWLQQLYAHLNSPETIPGPDLFGDPEDF